MGRIVGKRPIGAHHHGKQTSPDRAMLCHVRVFLLAVERRADEWPGKAQRERCRVDPLRAADMVQGGGLARIPSEAFPLVSRMGPPPTKRRRLPR